MPSHHLYPKTARDSDSALAIYYACVTSVSNVLYCIAQVSARELNHQSYSNALLYHAEKH